MASLSPSWVSQSTFNITARCVGHGKVNSQRNYFSVIPFLLHKSTSQRKVFMFASDQQHMPLRWLNLSFNDAVNLFHLYFHLTRVVDSDFGG